VASAALGATTLGGDRALAALAGLVSSDPTALTAWLSDLNLRAEQRDGVLRAARAAPVLAGQLRRELRPSQLYDLLEGEPPEALALALAFRAPPEPILRYLSDLRPVQLEIGGDDLIAAGIPESAAIGRALEETLRRKLDGEVTGREQELETALELARGDG
jgi:tRNA nucleotidyltransferase (CCA-adding enzyme)